MKKIFFGGILFIGVLFTFSINQAQAQTPPADKFQVGDQVVATTGGHIESIAGNIQSLVGTAAAGAPGTIIAGPSEPSPYTYISGEPQGEGPGTIWYKVDFGNRYVSAYNQQVGWVSEYFLTKPYDYTLSSDDMSVDFLPGLEGKGEVKIVSHTFSRTTVSGTPVDLTLTFSPFPSMTLTTPEGPLLTKAMTTPEGPKLPTNTDPSSVTTSFNINAGIGVGKFPITVTASGPGAITHQTTFNLVVTNNNDNFTFTSWPTSITAGQGANLYWATVPATGTTLKCTSPQFTVTMGSSGFLSLYPTQTTTYTITCVSSTGQSKSLSATVNVGTVNPLIFSASPTSITAGQSSTLSWKVVPVAGTALEGNIVCTSPQFTVTDLSGSVKVTPTKTTTYTISCMGSNGQGVSGGSGAQATVTVGTSSDVPSPTASGTTFSRTLSYGLMNDSDVVILQNILTADGYFSGSSTGNFQASTQQAVKDFQTANGLIADGIVGQNTRTILFSGTAIKASNVRPPNTSGTTFSRTLSYGLMNDSDVVILQNILTADGYVKDSSNGNFLYSTQQAVKDFQTANGLTADGIVGQNTRTILFSGTAIKASNVSAPDTYPSGDVNGDGSVTCTDVKLITDSTVGLGSLSADQKSRADVNGDGAVNILDAQKIAKDNNLSCSTDVPPPNTSSTTFTRTLSSGLMNDSDVVILQNILRADGYFSGSSTGNFQTSTQQAVKDFQTANGLIADGVVGPKTRSVLFSGIAVHASDVPPTDPNRCTNGATNYPTCTFSSSSCVVKSFSKVSVPGSQGQSFNVTLVVTPNCNETNILGLDLKSILGIDPSTIAQIIYQNVNSTSSSSSSSSSSTATGGGCEDGRITGFNTITGDPCGNNTSANVQGNVACISTTSTTDLINAIPDCKGGWTQNPSDPNFGLTVAQYLKAINTPGTPQFIAYAPAGYHFNGTTWVTNSFALGYHFDNSKNDWIPDAGYHWDGLSWVPD